MRVHPVVLLLILCSLFLPTVATGASDPVMLDTESERYDLSLALSYLEDESGQLELEEVRELRQSGDFQGGQSEALNFGFTESAYWFHVQLEAGAPPDEAWVLESLYPIMDHLELYVVYPDGDIARYYSGDSVPFDQRSRDHQHINFEFTIEPGQTLDLYMRAETSGAVQMPMTLWTKDAFYNNDHVMGRVFGMYYGLILALAVYNLLIFLSIRDVNYLLYVAYIAAYGLFQASLNGFAFEFLWPDSPWWNNRSIAFTMGLGMVFIIGFSQSFLSLKTNAPRAHKLFSILMLAFMGIAATSLVLPYGPVIRVGTLLTAITAIAIFVVGMKCWLQDFKPARYFMISWTLLLMGMLVYTLKTFGLLPANFFTEFSIQIGSALEMIFLSMALADRIRLVTNENQRLQRVQNEELEKRVSERTLELEEANNKLKELNAIDGLTQLKNRDFFYETLDNEWRKNSRKDNHISLLLLDVDRFKEFNDDYGHLCGDACLKHLARVYEDSVSRAGDYVARYGGEEFAILLCHTTPEGAETVAERVRERVENTPLEWDGEQIPVTVSIGVSSHIPRPKEDMTLLIGEADQALYEAKAEGRNRVKVYSEPPSEPEK
ncbi:diguanylate cyclase [Halospina denitrificans]|uniref:diguanylate cyclase n=1 Tax=Halospina denitrificans TaxID=332522 RepID=A0A4R7JM64_9GAMM|nr:7TM diverse intracellular signaling domain-containing protein [Halospina denitrificans]TDT38606.1 diguanylate cyclase [Halospina denitrificans]